ncbi:unnamed protein product [Brachionus calyciflorus]|uniref:Uncharacterized protein n=1 Tax=Brachionus calyciflorus TaxID=104777 RepID=A0A814S763_9BILA|nr:unnamed protein product [Brachionus calyciflorus]
MSYKEGRWYFKREEREKWEREHGVTSGNDKQDQNKPQNEPKTSQSSRPKQKNSSQRGHSKREQPKKPKVKRLNNKIQTGELCSEILKLGEDHSWDGELMKKLNAANDQEALT